MIILYIYTYTHCLPLKKYSETYYTHILLVIIQISRTGHFGNTIDLKQEAKKDVKERKVKGRK